MKKRILAVVLAAVMALSLSACGSKKSENADQLVLKVGMEGTYAPYTYHDENGTLTGFEVDVARAIGEKMGYEVEFVETEWDSMFAALDAGNFDVVMNQVTITDQRLEIYDFSTPYIYTKPILIVAADNDGITSFDDLTGKKAAEGLTSNFNQIAKDYGATIVGQDEFALAMECVLSGEADCAINDELTYAYWMTQKGDTTSTKVVASSDEVTSSAVVIKQGREEFLEEINNAINELIEDGTIAAISEKYFSMDISVQ